MELFQNMEMVSSTKIEPNSQNQHLKGSIGRRIPAQFSSVVVNSSPVDSHENGCAQSLRHCILLHR